MLPDCYVRLVDHMGTDLSVVNAARASFEKEEIALSPGGQNLIHFLAASKPPHTAPFRHAMLTFEVRAPLMVCRQWWKHVVGSTHYDGLDGWNESSRRYVRDKVSIYVPCADQWRVAPLNRKQGSGEGCLSTAIGEQLTKSLEEYAGLGEALYNEALEAGVATEQARLFLPAYGLLVTWRWTCSLQACVWFCKLRLGEGAQSEITVFAERVKELAEKHFPISVNELMTHM